MPDDETRYHITHDGRTAMRKTPSLKWIIERPLFLTEEGWGRTPATVDTNLTISALLEGENADKFDGRVFLSIDGEQVNFNFSGNTLTADISGLKPGSHHLYLMAVSRDGEAGYLQEFDVLSEPPGMQIGIELETGCLHIDFDRPIPTTYIGDLSKWNLEGFDTVRTDVRVHHGNRSVTIWLDYPFQSLDEVMIRLDEATRAQGRAESAVTFDSPLGEMKSILFTAERGGSRYAQSTGCEKGTVYPLETCYPAADWSINIKHLKSLEREDRQVINADKSMDFYGCPYNVLTPWRNCNVWNVVAYNWHSEGHLDPYVNWGAQYDTVEYGAPSGFKGVGYPNGRWEVFPRNKGFFPPSLCGSLNTKWEVRVDCNVCDVSEPYGYESKGWSLDEEIPVDSTNPEIEEIIIMPGSELDDYVENTLLGDLQDEGAVYAADPEWDGTLLEYYETRCGSVVDPDEIVIIVKASDQESTEGLWIHHELSIDYTVNGNNYILEDEVLHFYYVDKPPLATLEVTDTYWPYGDGCNNQLPADGYTMGEYSVWIIRAGCSLLEWDSCRVRVKDDCNNWTRSDDLAFDANPMVQITSPIDESEHEYGESVLFNAQIQDIPQVLAGLGDYIKWSVRKAGSSTWYGPYEPAPYNYWENEFDSLLPFYPEDWTGTTFEIIEFKDCEGLDVLARLDVCNIPADMVTIHIEGTTNTRTIGIIVEDKHQSGSGDYLLVTKTNEEPGAWNNAPIIERNANSLCVLEYAVQLQCNNPCDKPEFIDTKVKAIFDEKPDEITVRLFPVDTESSRHGFLDELFDNDQEYKYAYYYESDEDVAITAQFGSYDWDAPAELGPRLSLNNGPTINKDYTIILSYDSQEHYFRNPDLFYLSDPDNTPKINNIPVFRRGLLHGGATSEEEPLPPENYCDFNKEELPCFKSDVLLWGFEPVRVSLMDQSDHATIGVQSKAEVIFVMAHGYQDFSGAPDPPERPQNFESLTVPERQTFWGEMEEWANTYAKCVAVGPFYPNLNVIMPEDIISNEYLIGVKWFITTACRFLNHSSWQYWQSAVQSSPLYAMCGFRGLAASGSFAYSADFWNDFSVKLSSGDENNPISIVSDYWACPASSDHAVRAWMQNAVEHTRKDAVGKSVGFKTIPLAAAVDDDNGYYIDFIRKGWWDPFPPNFRITTY